MAGKRCWDTNHAGYRDVFCAALSGILANPQFFGPIMQGDPEAAVAMADRVVRASIEDEEAAF